MLTVRRIRPTRSARRSVVARPDARTLPKTPARDRARAELERLRQEAHARKLRADDARRDLERDLERLRRPKALAARKALDRLRPFGDLPGTPPKAGRAARDAKVALVLAKDTPRHVAARRRDPLLAIWDGMSAGALVDRRDRARRRKAKPK